MEDDEEMYELKSAISSLDELDRKLIILYADLASYGKMSKLLHVSRSTIYLIIKEIKEKIKERL